MAQHVTDHLSGSDGMALGRPYRLKARSIESRLPA